MKFLKISLVSLLLFSLVLAQGEIPKRKQTKLGLYITAQQAYARWKANPDKIKILDVRTPEEYVFVGHAPMAVNIPLLLMEHRADPEKKRYAMKKNENFVEQVKMRFSPEDTLFVMCRSGGRSAMSCNILAEHGFKHVFNIYDGFEGDKDKDTGKRVVNGWKSSGAPWTYDLDPKLIWQEE